ncbi:MAG: peptide-binding protein [Desulfarculales bacterium]|jgi:peptide/nickel transport system substrate-binding protein|nr:peptide-binding protein [Desulfarculales bacterium]
MIGAAIRTRIRTAICGSFILLSVTTAGGAGDCPATGDTVVIATIGDATSMIPMITSDTASHEMSAFCYNGLLKYDKDLSLVGDLAQSWRISEDNLTITFYLRQNVRFHDGQPYTAHDALFNWRFMVDPATPTGYSYDYEQVAEAEVLDDYTFQVRYAAPYAPGLASWTLPQMPRHLLEGQDPRQSPLSRHPVGTGPYLFRQWNPGESLTLSYNRDYFEGRPCLDAVVYRIIPDLATIFMELSALGLDWSTLTPVQYQRQANSEFFQNNFNKYKYLSSSYSFIGWNMRDPRFQDIRIRRAMSHAIDRREIIKGVLLGMGQEATGPLKPGTYWYNPNVPRYEYDPQKALQLFKEAGWELAPDGRLRNAGGDPFDFVLITNQGNTSRQNAGVFIQYRLAQVGIKVDLRVIEWTSFLQEFVNQRRFDAVLLGWTIPPDPSPSLYSVFHSSNRDPGKLNITGYASQELDALLEQELKVLEQTERKVLHDRIQEIIARDQPYTFLYLPQALPIVHRRFQGIEETSSGISHNFIRWHVPQEQQMRPYIFMER